MRQPDTIIKIVGAWTTKLSSKFGVYRFLIRSEFQLRTACWLFLSITSQNKLKSLFCCNICITENLWCFTRKTRAFFNGWARHKVFIILCSDYTRIFGSYSNVEHRTDIQLCKGGVLNVAFKLFENIIKHIRKSKDGHIIIRWVKFYQKKKKFFLFPAFYFLN